MYTVYKTLFLTEDDICIVRCLSVGQQMFFSFISTEKLINDLKSIVKVIIKVLS